jgi:hypothetical protein
MRLVRTAWVGPCRDAGLPYVDVGELGFESALREERYHLLALLSHRPIDPERRSPHPRAQ